MSKEMQRPAPSTNEQMITSLEIAELSGKPHNDLLKSIRKQEVAWKDVTGGNFSLSEYEDSSGRKLSMYKLSKAESLYISSKFNDAVRAKLVIRWYQLETGNAKGLKIYEHEKPLFSILKQFLVIGDIVTVARQLSLTAGHVGRVKNGRCRSHRVMAALMQRAANNKEKGIVNGYKQDFVQLALEFFEPQKTLGV